MRAAHYLLGLASGGVYIANCIAAITGGLLHRRFTLTNIAVGGLLSVALSRSLRTVGVTHHRVLWSPDFPPDETVQRTPVPLPTWGS